MASRVYEDILKEHFDIADDYTRKTLLGINEADQNKVLESLTSKLYQSIVDKVDDIDFGSIPDSKGDITKIENYDRLIECIGVIREILIQNRQNTSQIDTIQLATENVQKRKDAFEKGFLYKLQLPMMLYNSIVMAIVGSVSLIISTSIEYVKSGKEDYTISFDKVSYVRTNSALLFQNLIKFNKACATGEIDHCLDHVIKTGQKNLLGVDDTLGVVTAMGVVAIIVTIVPLLRELVFFFFNTKQGISDYFAIQADLLAINAEYVKNDVTINKPAKKRNDISRKQAKIAERFRKISNALAVDRKMGEQKAKSAIKSEERKYKLDDVTDEKLDSAPSSNDSSIF